MAQYNVGQKDVETLLALDEFDGNGIRYFEEVTGGDAKLGKRAINWSAHPFTQSRGVKLTSLRIAHELLGQLGKTDRIWTPEVIPSNLMREIVLAVDGGQTNGQSAG